MKSKLFTVLAAVAALTLDGCAVGPVEKIPVSMPDGEKATIVAHDQSVPDWWLRTDGLKLNFVVKGDVSDKQLAAVAESERACRIYTDTVRPNVLVGVLSQGTLYALVGYVGVGIGSQAFAGAVRHEYAKYGAWATGMSGVANGLISNGGKTYTFENCGRELLDIFPNYKVRVIMKSPY